MKILITGVLGVLGSKLEEVLLRQGHEVFGVDLRHTNKNYGHGLGKVKEENYFRCDIGEYRQIYDVIEHVKPDLVYNFAAEFGRWNSLYFYEQVWKTNCVGVENILRLQKKFNFKLVHASSSEVYGDTDKIMVESLLDTDAIEQLNSYAMTKRCNEMQIKNYNVLYGNQVAMVRFFNTYGPGEYYHPFRSVNCTFTYNLLSGKPVIVYKGHIRSSTYIDDAINAMANFVENFKSGEIYNVACSRQHTIEELVDLIVNTSGADKELVRYVDKHEVLTTVSKKVDNSKIIKDLGYVTTVSLEEGVKRTVEWMKKYYGF